MDGARFDAVTRWFGLSANRRGITAALLGVTAGMLGPSHPAGAIASADADVHWPAVTVAAARAAKPRCLPTGRRCSRRSGGGGDHCRRCCTGHASRRPSGGGRCACKPVAATCAGHDQCCSRQCIGGACAVPCAEGGPCFVFAGDTRQNANFGGLSGADRICTRLARQGGLPGRYLAWLSTASASPSTRFDRTAGPYVLVDGTVIATGWADLTDASLAAPINRTAHGAPVTANPVTATSPEGTLWIRPGNDTCTDWTQASPAATAAGDTQATDGSWTLTGVAPSCSASDLHLYCFQQP